MRLPSCNRFVAIVATVCALVAGFGCHATEDLTAEVAIRVGDATISRRQLEAALRRGNVAAIPSGPQRLEAAAAAAEQVVNEALFRGILAREGVTAEVAEIDTAFNLLVQQLNRRGETLAAFLERSARDEAEVRELAGLEIAMRHYVNRRLTPDAVETYYRQHRRDIDGTLVRLSHLILRPDLGRGTDAVNECIARAEAIRNRILQGELTFAAAVRAHSAGPSRRRDGDMGYLPRRSAADEEIAKQAFALAKGDVSRPVVTPFGVHLLQVTDVQPGRRTFADLRPEIERLMTQQITADALAEARRTTTVEFAPDIAHFDPATPAEGGGPRRIVGGEAGAAP